MMNHTWRTYMICLYIYTYFIYVSIYTVFTESSMSQVFSVISYWKIAHLYTYIFWISYNIFTKTNCIQGLTYYSYLVSATRKARMVAFIWLPRDESFQRHHSFILDIINCFFFSKTCLPLVTKLATECFRYAEVDYNNLLDDQVKPCYSFFCSTKQTLHLLLLADLLLKMWLNYLS